MNAAAALLRAAPEIQRPVFGGAGTIKGSSWCDGVVGRDDTARA